MPIRLATMYDIETIAYVSGVCFYNDPYVGEFVHPHRKLHPADWARWWRWRTQEHYWDYSRKHLVSYEITDDGKETVTGTAEWLRRGTGWRQVWGLWGKWDPRNAIGAFITAFHRFCAFIWPNRAADPTKSNFGPRVSECIKHHWTGKHADCWMLASLAVLPQSQGKGHGRDLVRWGLDQAEKEGVAASVVSAIGKERFYQRCGFDTLVGHSSDGEGNPLKGLIQGGAIFFKEPRDSKRD